MKYRITKLQKWLLKRIARSLVIQSHCQRENIIEYFKIIWVEAHREFYEDNYPTLAGFMEDCYEDAALEAYRESWRS